MPLVVRSKRESGRLIGHACAGGENVALLPSTPSHQRQRFRPRWKVQPGELVGRLQEHSLSHARLPRRLGHRAEPGKDAV